MQARDLVTKVNIVEGEANLSVVIGKMGRNGVVGVVEGGQFSGLIWEDAIWRASASIFSLSGLRARDLVISNLPLISGDTPVDFLYSLFAETGYPALPVFEDDGLFVGVVLRRDILRYRLGLIKPRSIGGMATPLGVYLTSGTVTGGAKHLGLFLTGVVFGIFVLVSLYMVDGLAYLTQVLTPLPLYAIKKSPPIGGLNVYDMWNALLGLLQIGIFLFLLWISPLSAYHGAEHKVVNAIENGEELIPERVSLMPKEHPRCGTNLVAFLVVFFLLSEVASPLLALIVAFLSWRFLGMRLQRYITTREPKMKHILNAIKAGKELLEKYRTNPYPATSTWQRIWNMGIIQVMIGYGLIFSLYEFISNLIR